MLAATRDEIVDCGAGVRLLGHFSPQRSATRGLVILLHGWEGSAAASYVLSAGGRLYEAGFDVFRLNFRDHGDTFALNRELFHSCRIDEVVGAVQRIIATHRAPRMFLVGHSLGGNFALRVAARAPAAGIDLARVVAICPVLRPHSTMRALEEGLWVYREYFLRRWRRSLLAKAACFPELYDFGNLREAADTDGHDRVLRDAVRGIPRSRLVPARLCRHWGRVGESGRTDTHHRCGRRSGHSHRRSRRHCCYERPVDRRVRARRALRLHRKLSTAQLARPRRA